MDLHNLFEQHLQRIDVLNDFIVLYGKKEETVTDLRDISKECDEIKELLVSCKELLDKFQNENMQKCREIIEKSQKQQLIMLHILEQVIDDNDEEKMSGNRENRDFKSPLSSSCQRSDQRSNSVLTEISNTMTPSKFTPFKPGEQPIMTYADYIKSPYATKRMRPLALQFTDFERTITSDEFNKVPGYMKGRETLDDIQNFLETVIIRCFTSKYTLLPKKREALAPMEMDLWSLYKSQEEYFKGQKFITQGDICRQTDKQIDKKTGARITMLRHLKVIREERKNSAICYIWCKN